MATLTVALGFIALLGLEWWRQQRSVRLVTTLLALGALAFTQPNSYRAVRRALDLPAVARRTTWFDGGRPLSEYESGVLTHHEVFTAEVVGSATTRYISLGVLVWLAISPTLRSARRQSDLSGFGERQA